MLTGAVVFGALAVYVWQRDNAGANGLTLALVAGVWYMGTYALELSSLDPDAKRLWGDVKYVGIGLLPPAFLAFTLQYTGRMRWLSRRLFLLLSVEPLVVLVLLAIPATHDLVRIYPGSAATEQFPIVGLGPIGWINVAYSYGILLFSTGLFVKRLPPSLAPTANRPERSS
jgi:hypothetical protein